MNVPVVKPVSNRIQRRQFLTFPWRVYQADPHWVPPLIPERRQVIHPRQGHFFERGVAEFFIAYQDGKPVGTICAAEDPPVNRQRKKKECIFGFLEYVKDYQVFECLIQQAVEWARKRGLTSLYGPWNLDYEDGYGVLVEGWNRPPALMCGHSPPYYPRFMERIGFQPARAENVALELQLSDSSEFSRLHRLAEKLSEKKQIVIRSADFAHWDQEVDRLHHLLTRSLAHLNDHIGWRRDNLEVMLAPFRRIADPDLILFADVGGETVGFLPGLPNLNQIMIHANGLRYPWDYLRLFRAWKMKPVEELTIKSVLVLPEYWNTGVAVKLFSTLIKRAMERGYHWADLSITSADNPSSVLTAEKAGAAIYKRWQIYRLGVD